MTHLLDEFDAARLVGLTHRKINRLVRARLIPHLVMPGGDVRFSEADLWAWAASFKQPVVAGNAESETLCTS